MSTQTEQAATKAPEIPGELWMLMNRNDSCEPEGGWVRSFDDAPSGETFLVAFSEKEALAAAAHQNELYFLNCVPVRVK
jgi:hypothetical protein